MLEVEHIRVSYGAAVALWDVSIRIADGELVCVVGPNGAGKTTLINAIAGINRIGAGGMRMNGQISPRCRPMPSAITASPSFPKAGACSSA